MKIPLRLQIYFWAGNPVFPLLISQTGTPTLVFIILGIAYNIFVTTSLKSTYKKFILLLKIIKLLHYFKGMTLFEDYYFECPLSLPSRVKKCQ